MDSATDNYVLLAELYISHMYIVCRRKKATLPWISCAIFWPFLTPNRMMRSFSVRRNSDDGIVI